MNASAHVGSPSKQEPVSNVVDWIFSNPFHSSSQIIKNAPSKKAQQHAIPRVPVGKPIFIDTKSGSQSSWKQTRDESLRIASGLRNLGLRPSPYKATSAPTEAILSPVILIHLPNSPAFAPLLFGALAAGLTATMANSSLTSTEIQWILVNSSPSLIVTCAAGLKQVQDAINVLPQGNLKKKLLSRNRIYVTDAESSSPIDNLPRPQKWTKLLSDDAMHSPVTFTKDECRDRAAVILWSSGTSGKSKGVVLSHQALIASLIAQWHVNVEFTASERWLGFVPFYHVFGLVCCLLLAPACGATVYLMPQFEPVKMLSYVENYRITFLHIAPPIAVILAKNPIVKEFDLSSIKGAMSGGAPLGHEVIEMVHKKAGFLVKLGYGLSEAGSVSHVVGDTWEDVQRQLGSCGPPLYGVEIKVINTDGSSTTLKRDEEGEILIRSLSNLKCYLNNSQATAESLDSDGWFHTGDVGKVDEDGNLWITDRLKEMIKVKSFQVSPAELEDVLCGLPLVADAAVTSIFDSEEQSEYPKAYVVPAEAEVLQSRAKQRDFAQDVKQWVEQRTSKYKWLRGGLVLVSSVPKSPSGKILRRMLKDTAGIEISLYMSDRKVLSKL